MDRVNIPVFLNASAGRADEVRKAIAGIDELELRETDPADLARAVASAAREGARRIVIAGGDGSISSAAAVLVGTEVSLAIIPGGTLNHLAKDLKIPLDLREAASTAVTGHTITIDVGRAGDRVFLNTSSVGAYVLFVKTRDRLEGRLGYYLASLVAAVRLYYRLPLYTVRIEVDGMERLYVTPIVFIGVGERETKLPKLGGRVEGGRRGLHVMVVQGRGRARLLALAFAAVARGLRSVARGPMVDAFLLDQFPVEHTAGNARIAVDGEIIDTTGALEYVLLRDALRVVVPWRTP
jgi:diacylglycerol kinase family enzyme